MNISLKKSEINILLEALKPVKNKVQKMKQSGIRVGLTELSGFNKAIDEIESIEKKLKNEK